MQNLVVCCDGTWNTPDQTSNHIPSPTNVVRLRNCLADGQVTGGSVERKKWHMATTSRCGAPSDGTCCTAIGDGGDFGRRIVRGHVADGALPVGQGPADVACTPVATCSSASIRSTAGPPK